jgi:cytochrome c peroxidase
MRAASSTRRRALNRLEMRDASGNHLAALPDSDMQGTWRGAMRRVSRIPRYREMFEDAYPGTRFEQMTFAYATNAIAGFTIANFTFDRSPWDHFLAGDDDALTTDQLLGAKDFLSLKCSICHNGSTFSDGQFHDVALAQFGPGEGVAPNPRDDFGRMNVTGRPADIYRFRTSPLRNIELTGPYGHAGQFKELRAFIAHYSQSDVAAGDSGRGAGDAGAADVAVAEGAVYCALLSGRVASCAPGLPLRDCDDRGIV